MKDRVTATPEQIQALEHVYRTEPFPQASRFEELVPEVNLTMEWIRSWFYRRRNKDRGQPPQNLPPPPPPPPATDAQILGAIEEHLNTDQPQQEEDEEEVNEDEMFDFLLSDPIDGAFNLRELTAGALAETAISELRRLSCDSRLWAKDLSRRDVLTESLYVERFPRHTDHLTSFKASRDIRSYRMVNKELAEMLFEGKWSTLFPFMVAKEETIEVFPSSSGYPDGSSTLIYREYHTTIGTPEVAKRKVLVVRTCKQIKEGWLVAEVSPKPDQVEDLVENDYQLNAHRFPSGCLIEDLANGLSRVTWVEHMGFAELVPDNLILRGGMVFGAQGMLDLLERPCDRRRNTIRSIENLSSFNVKEKQFLMNSGSVMVTELYRTISHDEEVWSSIGAPDVYTTLYEHSLSNDVAVGAITFNVAQSPEFVLQILGDEHIHHEWDALGGFRSLHPMTTYPTGNDNRNKISVSLVEDPTHVGESVVVQEVTISRAGSLVVWSMIPRGTSFQISLGQDLAPDVIPPWSVVSGFSISTDGNTRGSVVTLVLRMLVVNNQDESEQERSEQAIESITLAVNHTVLRVRECLEIHSPTAPGGV